MSETDLIGDIARESSELAEQIKPLLLGRRSISVMVVLGIVVAEIEAQSDPPHGVAPSIETLNRVAELRALQLSARPAGGAA